MTVERKPSEAGMSMVALIAAMSIMFIMMGAAVPAWRYVMKDAREEELLFRGDQIARALKCYEDKFKQPAGNLEIMVQQRCLRKAYKEPFAKDGKWRFIRQGEVQLAPGVGAGGIVGLPVPPTTLAAQQQPGIRQGREPQGTGQPQLGGAPIWGVASFSKDKSLRIFNGYTRYSDWWFKKGEKGLLGRNLPPGVANPGVTPTPATGTGPATRRQEQK